MYICAYLFFFNDTATTEIYTLSLHDALPIFQEMVALNGTNLFYRSPDLRRLCCSVRKSRPLERALDRKSTRLNSSHTVISYAVFCLKKKKNNNIEKPHLRTITIAI